MFPTAKGGVHSTCTDFNKRVIHVSRAARPLVRYTPEYGAKRQLPKMTLFGGCKTGKPKEEVNE